MHSRALRTITLAAAICAMSFAAWRWPASWHLPVRPGGTIGEPSAPSARKRREPIGSSRAWMLLITAMAVLMGAWLLAELR